MKKYGALLISLLIFYSCGDKSVESTSDKNFSLLIRVNDANGISLSNVNVSVRSVKDYSKVSKKVASAFNIKSETNIDFGLMQDCFVDLSVYNLNGVKIENLINKQLNAGMYRVRYDLSEPVGTRVYLVKC